MYLEDQTEGLVQSIQALVSSIRGEENMPSVRTHIDSISTVVGKVLSSTENTISDPNSNPALAGSIAPVLQTLSDCRNNLLNAGAEGDHINDPSEIRQVTGKLPPLAFQIARETKELVQRVDQVELESREHDGEDDFR